ncbi:MAG: hypothetical protein JSV09_13065 [Thermoplasmata archaeon]|nr:MAG: hypothetical protein JSV09_13065 [Thermoplasmata archaeon]
MNESNAIEYENKMKPTYLGYVIIMIFVAIALLLTVFYLDSFLEKLFSTIVIIFFIIVGVRMNYYGDKNTPYFLLFMEEGIQTALKDGKEIELIPWNRIISIEPSVFIKDVYNFYYYQDDDSNERRGFGVTAAMAAEIQEELKRRR